MEAISALLCDLSKGILQLTITELIASFDQRRKLLQQPGDACNFFGAAFHAHTRTAGVNANVKKGFQQVDVFVPSVKEDFCPALGQDYSVRAPITFTLDGNTKMPPESVFGPVGTCSVRLCSHV